MWYLRQLPIPIFSAAVREIAISKLSAKNDMYFNAYVIQLLSLLCISHTVFFFTETLALLTVSGNKVAMIKWDCHLTLTDRQSHHRHRIMAKAKNRVSRQSVSHRPQMRSKSLFRLFDDQTYIFTGGSTNRPTTNHISRGSFWNDITSISRGRSCSQYNGLKK